MYDLGYAERHLLDIARMPLAKYMIKSAPGFRDNHHYPTGGWGPDTGMVGWSMFDPYEKKMRFFYRTMIANEFLSITANEPLFTVLPIGGPLGKPYPQP